MTFSLCSGRPCRRLHFGRAHFTIAFARSCLGTGVSFPAPLRAVMTIWTPGCHVRTSPIMKLQRKIPFVDHFTLSIPSRLPMVWLFVTLAPWWRWYRPSCGYQSVSFGLN